MTELRPLARMETPAEYRRRIGLPYDPWIDPPEHAPEAWSSPCAVCAAGPWRYGCPACGHTPNLAADLHQATRRAR